MKALPWQVYLCLWARTAWDWRYFILVLLITMPILGLTAGVLRPKMYETSMKILIQESAKHNPFLEDLAIETRVSDRISALGALLHSRHVLIGVARDLEMIDADSPIEEVEPVIARLSKQLSVRLIGDELVELRYKQNATQDIEKVLIAVAQRFMEKVLAPERSSIAGSQKFLEEQIVNSTKELVNAEARLSEYTSQHAASLPELHPGNVRRLAELKLALSERRTGLEGAEARYTSLIQRLAQNNPVIAQIEKSIIDISAELAALRARYTNRHSAVKAAERKQTRLTAERDAMLARAPLLTAEEVEEIWTVAAQSVSTGDGMSMLLISQLDRLQEAKSELINLERQTETLEKEVEDLDALVIGYGAIETRLKRLQSDVEVKRDVHAQLRERAEMARVTGALGQFEAPERVKIIDHPAVPTKPIGFPPMVFAILGLVAGIATSIGLIALSEVMEGTIRTKAELVTLSGVQVVTRIPNLVSPLDGLMPKKQTRRRLPKFNLRKPKDA